MQNAVGHFISVIGHLTQGLCEDSKSGFTAPHTPPPNVIMNVRLFMIHVEINQWKTSNWSVWEPHSLTNLYPHSYTNNRMNNTFQIDQLTF